MQANSALKPQPCDRFKHKCVLLSNLIVVSLRENQNQTYDAKKVISRIETLESFTQTPVDP